MNPLQKKQNGQKGRKSPELAFVLSLIFPGAGQFYNVDVRKGLTQELLIAGGLVLVFSERNLVSSRNSGGFGLGTQNIVGLTIVAGGYLWSLIDAPISAFKKNNVLEQNQYGHLLEFHGGKQVVGIDLGYYGSNLGGKITLHF